MRSGVLSALFAVLAVAPMATFGADVQCLEKSPKQIVASYGRIWGDVSAQRGIGSVQSRTLKRKLRSYYVCVAVENKRADVLNELSSIPFPGELSLAEEYKRRIGDLERVPENLVVPETALSAQKKDVFNFINYFAGGGGTIGSCGRYYQNMTWLVPDRIRPQESFCKVVERTVLKRGKGDFCAELLTVKETPTPPGIYAGCLRAFPEKESDCRGSAECKERLALYLAIRDGNLAACPRSYKHLCAGLADENVSTSAAALRDKCAKPARDLENAYCTMYKEAAQRTSGPLGMTDKDAAELQKINLEIKKTKGNAE